MAKSTDSASLRKPQKPTADFPLYAHRTRRWAKKCNGKTLYFGPWHDPYGALQSYREWQEQQRSGGPQLEGDQPTVFDLLKAFIDDKKVSLAAGQLSQRSYDDYFATCKRIERVFGLRRQLHTLNAADWQAMRADIASKRGVTGQANEINRVRCVFKFAATADIATVNYALLKRPRKELIRAEKNSKPKKLFSRDEIHLMLAAATDQMRAMILLGVNCGYGNHDIARVPTFAFDFRTRWVEFARVKTAVMRRCPLWPETIAAVQHVIETRKPAKKPQHEQLVFRTRCGLPWADDRKNAISSEFTKLTKSLGIHKPRVGFYALRHTFETEGGDCKDQVAVDAIMGHVDNSMAGVYREGISDERLVAVTDHVHAWLFGQEGGAA